MLIIGCDYHPGMQQIAWFDEASGECGEQRLEHSTGEGESYYRELKRRGVQVRMGIEASGHTRWFERMRGENPGGGKMRRGISSLPVLRLNPRFQKIVGGASRY